MSELVFTILPVKDDITAHFGDQFEGFPHPHLGVDFGCPIGTPVRAPADGTVTDFYNDGSFGKGVCLDHKGTIWYSLYAHLSSIVVVIGQKVQEGEVIGLTGNTGLSTGPHLHWQVCQSSSFPTNPQESADPLSFYKPWEAAMTPAETEIFDIAGGDYDRMCQVYKRLVELKVLPDEGITDVDDLNSAVVKRFRIQTLVGNAKEVLGKLA